MTVSSALRKFSIILFSALLSIAALADTLPVPQNGFTFQRLEGGDIVRNPQPRGRAVLGRNLFGVRGVLLQSTAVFVDAGAQVSIADVDLEWLQQGDNRVVCLRYQGNCTIIDLDQEVIFRAAYWVATSQSTVAFTLLPQRAIFSESRLDFAKSGYVAPTAGFSYVRVSSTGETEIRTASETTLSNVVTHPALDHSGVLSALAYIDFVDSWQSGPRSNLALVPHDGADELVSSLNSNGDPSFVNTTYQYEDVLDGSYTNADVDSEFIVEFSTGQVSGQPLRYFWDRVEGRESPYFRSIYRFNALSEVPPNAPRTLRERHREALLFSQLVATLRVYQFQEPEGLAEFVNQGLEARTRN